LRAMLFIVNTLHLVSKANSRTIFRTEYRAEQRRCERNNEREKARFDKPFQLWA